MNAQSIPAVRTFHDNDLYNDLWDAFDATGRESAPVIDADDVRITMHRDWGVTFEDEDGDRCKVFRAAYTHTVEVRDPTLDARGGERWYTPTSKDDLHRALSTLARALCERVLAPDWSQS